MCCKGTIFFSHMQVKSAKNAVVIICSPHKSRELAQKHRILSMETIKLSNGVEMPLLGYGGFQVPPQEARRHPRHRHVLCLGNACQRRGRQGQTDHARRTLSGQIREDRRGAGGLPSASSISSGLLFRRWRKNTFSISGSHRCESLFFYFRGKSKKKEIPIWKTFRRRSRC